MQRPVRLITLMPGHFHAALVQKWRLHGVHRRTYVYAPLDADTLAHLTRIAAFNNRADDPTAWEINLYAGPNYLDRFAREQPGNTVILSGQNRPKIDLMLLAVANNLNVIADKPWIVDQVDFPKLQALLHDADLREVLVWDILTERHEITNILQRQLTRDPELFGRWQTGSPQHPALILSSVHFLKKTVNGEPLVRPWWWFNPAISGEAMADVGTHLADLALWLVAPEQPVDYATQIQMLTADRCPLLLTEDQFRTVTGLPGYPPQLDPYIVNGSLYYAGNNTATFTIGPVHVRLKTTWEYESAHRSGDTHTSTAHGTRAVVEVRQESGSQPELFVRATDPANHATMWKRLEAIEQQWAAEFPGISITNLGNEAQVVIPKRFRTGHEDHFASVMEEYVRYFHTPHAVPAWERPNALARYYITTKAVELAQATDSESAHIPCGH